MHSYRSAKLSLRSLRLSLRFVIPLAGALALLAYAVVPLVDHFTLQWFVRDINIRSRLITSTLQEPLTELLQSEDRKKINALLLRTIQDERLMAVAICDGSGKLLYKTPTFPNGVNCRPRGTAEGTSPSLLHLPQGLVHVNVNPIDLSGGRTDFLLEQLRRRDADGRPWELPRFPDRFADQANARPRHAEAPRARSISIEPAGAGVSGGQFRPGGC